MVASELGERLRRLRFARSLTLKQVEEKAHVSATHLSEIERGKTSPTVGALVRIARALGEDAARLVEDDAPPRVSLVRRDERSAFVERGATFHRLSRPIDVEDLSLFEIDLPGGGPEGGRVPVGAREAFVLVLRGAVELETGAQRMTLKEGDACHFAPGEASELRSVGTGGARLLCATSPRVPI
jgi:transcriptional regulator with XRE-family HTH domain